MRSCLAGYVQTVELLGNVLDFKALILCDPTLVAGEDELEEVRQVPARVLHHGARVVHDEDRPYVRQSHGADYGDRKPHMLKQPNADRHRRFVTHPMVMPWP
jgi:hypothetical protein